MASSSSVLLSKLILSLFITHIVLTTSIVEDTSLKLVRDALERPLPISIYSELNDDEEADEEIDDDEGENGYSGRSLFWKRMRYYISYGALWANRIPCPPRSGKSYYTHNCFKVHGLFFLTLGVVQGSLAAGDDELIRKKGGCKITKMVQALSATLAKIL